MSKASQRQIERLSEIGETFYYNGNDELVDRIGYGLSYGDIGRSGFYAESEVLIEIPVSGGSDHSGSTVNLANYEALQKQYGKRRGVFSAYGGHGTYALFLAPSLMSWNTAEEFCEIFEALQNYSLLDEQAYYDLENEKTEEAWENWVESEFRSELEKRLDVNDHGLDLDDIEDEQIKSIFWAEQPEWYCEGMGSDMYVDIEPIISGIYHKFLLYVANL